MDYRKKIKTALSSSQTEVCVCCVHAHVCTEIKVVLGKKDVEIVREDLLDNNK